MKQKNVEIINWGMLILFIIAILALLFVLIFCISPLQTKCTDLENNIAKLQSDVSTLFANPPENNSTPADYEKTLSFLQDEFHVYREFIQQQQQHIIWLVGIALALFGAVVGFFSFTKRKDIKDIVSAYAETDIIKEIKRELAKEIGDNPDLEYVKNSVNREEKARRKSILFAIDDREFQTQLKEVLEYFRNEKFNIIGDIKSLHIGNYNKIFRKEDYDILVYQVSKEERRDNPAPANDLVYNLLAKEYKKPGIFYCPGFEIDRNNFDQIKYTTVQYIPKLKETLYTMLYYGD